MYNLCAHETSIILGKTIEKSTVAFSCHIKYLDLETAINYKLRLIRDQNRKLDKLCVEIC